MDSYYPDGFNDRDRDMLSIGMTRAEAEIAVDNLFGEIEELEREKSIIEDKIAELEERMNDLQAYLNF